MRVAPFLRSVRWAIWLVLLVAAGLLGFAILRPGPQDLPWTSLDLHQPIGLFTGRKLTALADEPARCLALLRGTGLTVEAVEPFGEGQCRVADAIRVDAGKEMLSLSPGRVAPSCPVMAATALWNWQVVQPAAQRLFGRSVARIEHLGSYNCRRMYGRGEGSWSEHATANALDVSAFVLTDGRRITVLKDWPVPGDEAAFLKAVRDGACKLFSTVLSPDYNAQHADHLHLDQAQRGGMGWRACR